MCLALAPRTERFRLVGGLLRAQGVHALVHITVAVKHLLLVFTRLRDPENGSLVAQL